MDTINAAIPTNNATRLGTFGWALNSKAPTPTMNTPLTTYNSPISLLVVVVDVCMFPQPLHHLGCHMQSIFVCTHEQWGQRTPRAVVAQELPDVFARSLKATVSKAVVIVFNL